MKKALVTLLAATFLGAAAPVLAQDKPATDPAALQALREKLRTDKKAVVAKNMVLSEAEAAKFWPLYEAYQKALVPINQRFNRAILDYVAAESSMTDKNAKRIMEEVAAADDAESKLRRSHFGKLSSAISAKKAARYLQIENKIRALERFDQAAAIPLVQ